MQDVAGPARDQQAVLGPDPQTLHRLVKWTHISGVAQCHQPPAEHLTRILPECILQNEHRTNHMEFETQTWTFHVVSCGQKNSIKG